MINWLAKQKNNNNIFQTAFFAAAMGHFLVSQLTNRYLLHLQPVEALHSLAKTCKGVYATR
jgi:hypothetical protein